MWHAVAVAWEQLCRPKKQGGVGIKSLRSMNEAFLSKILWKLHTDSTNLWVQVLLGKYGTNWNLKEKLVAMKFDSRLRKELLHAYVG